MPNHRTCSVLCGMPTWSVQHSWMCNHTTHITHPNVFGFSIPTRRFETKLRKQLNMCLLIAQQLQTTRSQQSQIMMASLLDRGGGHLCMHSMDMCQLKDTIKHFHGISKLKMSKMPCAMCNTAKACKKKHVGCLK